ncbi:MAG: bifunctional transaldolase/phosoglucose isomerase [Anaerolineae bacterium]|nr:bifunctional transaldolase/phosoglucose isomerase [Anaerolineae bacterium]
MMTTSMTPSIWYNHLSRDLIRSGELAQLITSGRLAGLRLNLALLERAIGEGDSYDEELVNTGEHDSDLALESLLIADVRAAADLLRPIYEESGGQKGFVCLDLSPLRADRPEIAVSEAKRLYASADRPNLMIEMIGKQTHLTAIEESLYAGVNVCISAVFSIRDYVQVAECYLRALERRLYNGQSVKGLVSIVQFDLSRVDAFVDKQLANNLRSAQGRGDLARVSANNVLIGTVGIANARRIYERFRELFHGDRFKRLQEAGALPQRLVWAEAEPNLLNLSSTAYLDALCTADTLVMASSATLGEYLQYTHSHEFPPTDFNAVLDTLRRAEEVGIDLEMINRRLQGDYEELLIDTFRKLITRLEGKRKTLLSGFIKRQALVLGVYQNAVETTLKQLRRQLSITRMWAKDTTLWTESAEQGEIIRQRLGWLTLPTDGRIERARLQTLREESRLKQWAHVVLLGMGGSSLAAEVIWRVLGRQPGYPELLLLDTTDPAAIQRVRDQIDLRRSVFIAASKSGTTLETQCLQRYFIAQLEKSGLTPGDHFIAITDPGSKLEQQSRSLGFRHVFLNPGDMPGRYAALSYFGLVPAALCGLNFERILQAGVEMQSACSSGVMGNNHPGLWLGTVMGVMAEHGRDKLSFLTSPEIAALPVWIEQLVAESLGKDGESVIPVVSTDPGMPHDYNDDRLFVYLRLDNGRDNPDDVAQMLREAGHPLVTLALRDKYDVGAEFFRWAFAAATAAMVLEVNPFDEPNVGETKNNTAWQLENFQHTGALPAERPSFAEDGVSLFTDEHTAELLTAVAQQRAYQGSPLTDALATFLTFARSGDYVAIMAFLDPSEVMNAHLETIQRRARHVLKRAVTIGFGPRFLHITGQMHKGGAPHGVFLQITAADQVQVPIPSEPYDFSILKQAQANGDLTALLSRGLRVARLDLGDNPVQGLHKISVALDAIAAKQL